MKKWIGSILFSLLFNCASATIYYVKYDGDNNNDGLTLESAWQTLQYAADMVEAGDEVHVSPGVYVGFYMTTSGTADQRISFIAEDFTYISYPNETTDDGVNLEGASYIDITGFTLEELPRAGIRSVLNTGVRIRQNHCFACGYWGIFTGFSENILIENNICEYSEIEHGIYHSNSADNAQILNNTCNNNNACGIHINGDISMGGDGIISNLLISGNIIYENGIGGGSGINGDGLQDSRIENNLLYRNHSSGISLYQIDAAEPAHNNVIVNNTIYQPDDGRWGVNITNGSSNCVIFNNVILSDHAFRGSITVDPVALATLQCDYNVLSNRMSKDDAESNMTFDEWTSETGMDFHSLMASTGDTFNDISSDDYHTGPMEVTVDSGIDVFEGHNAAAIDLDGAIRPWNDQFDIGCYEFYFMGIDENYVQDVLSWNEISSAERVTIHAADGRNVFVGKKGEFNIPSFTDGIYFFSGEEKGSGKFFLYNGNLK